MMDKHFLKFVDRKSWRAWLEAHASSASRAWLLIRKKHATIAGLSLADAVEEALCFGWIDSTLNRLDDQSYLLRFSPRRPDSIWSMTNIRRVGNLQESGLMTRAGLVAVKAAKANGQWQAAIERESTEIIPADLETSLNQTKGAMKGFRTLPVSKRKQYVYWLQSARLEGTRKKRITEIIKYVQSRLAGYRSDSS